MVKKLLFAVFLFYTSITYAETIKTDVLVIGGTASGAAAAIQSARSKVKTLWVMHGNGVEFTTGVPADIVATLGERPIGIKQVNAAGIWGEFRKQVINFYKSIPGYDTTYNATLKFDLVTGEGILKAIADTVKNLTIKNNTSFASIKKDGTGWEVSVTANGKTDIIKAKVVIDASINHELIKGVGAALPQTYNPYIDDQNDNLYRTSIATTNVVLQSKNKDTDLYPATNYGIPLKYAIVNNVDNLLSTESIIKVNITGYIPAQLNIGQGVGCIAAYCAFFKTTTKNLKPRIIQQELLDYKGILLPFADIKPYNKYIRAVQQIGATGLLKGIYKDHELLFMPDEVVTTIEIKPVLNEIYSRAFLWFDKEKPGEKFTVGNTLSLISEFTLTDPETLQVNLQKDWQDKYKFALAFDKNRPITRLEFAVLVNKYLNPFAHKIDLEGNMIN